MESDNSSSTCSSVSNGDATNYNARQLPSNYTLVSFLGCGGFGKVLRCVKEDTKETVAVKIPQYGYSFKNELSLLNFFKWKNLDKCNIVRFIDSFTLRNNRVALAFEMLDVTLEDYISFTPLEFHEVRRVVQQMATALNALKTYKVIHSDIKLDNIMLVDGNAQPLRVKLIDFGLAFPTSCMEQGRAQQTTHFRAPEIILGLPFSEAIDMWSLGVVMAFMVLGAAIFPGNSEYDVMRFIVELLGVPPDHLLSDGMYSLSFFVIQSSGQWRLMTPQQYWMNCTPPDDNRSYHFRSLDDLETLSQKNLNMVDVDEKKECIDLLKAMLRIDGDERIIPSQVLAHPFITRGTIHHSSDNKTLESSTSHTTDPGTVQAVEPGTIQANETNQSKADDCSSGIRDFHGSISALHPGVILVQPAPTEFCLRWDEDSGQQREACPFDELEAEKSPVGYPVEVESDPSPPPFLPEDLNMEQKLTELIATTSEDTEPGEEEEEEEEEEEQQKKKEEKEDEEEDKEEGEEKEEEEKKKEKEKKNSFMRFFSWLKRRFCNDKV